MLLLCFTSEQANLWVAAMDIWAYPSFLLSPLSVILYAQIHDAPNFCVCWHLITLQFRWDEVKGISLVVYEDILSETNFCILQCAVSALPRWFCCHFGLLLPLNVWTHYHKLGIPCFAVMLTTNWASFLGILLGQLNFMVCCSCSGVLPQFFMHYDLVQAHYGASKPLWEYLDLYWTYLIDLSFWLYFYSIVVPNLVQSPAYLVPYCKYWFTRNILQCVSVFRLCPKALAQHRWMLRLALRGFDITSHFIRIHNHLEQKKIIMHKSSNGLLLIKIGKKFSLAKVMFRFMNLHSL